MKVVNAFLSEAKINDNNLISNVDTNEIPLLLFRPHFQPQLPYLRKAWWIAQRGFNVPI